MLYPRYLLNASVSLYQRHDQGSAEHIGDLLYESTCRKRFFRDKPKEGYESTIRIWQRELVQDLSMLADRASRRTPIMENLRTTGYEGRPVNMLIGLNAVVGTHSDVFDSEIFFSHREARRRFFRSGGYCIRYRDAEDFESIELGLSNDYLFHRLHPSIVFRGKSEIMLGVNRWKNIDTVDHKIYDALIVDYSLSQSLIFNPLDRRSLLLGIGLQENPFYIFSKRFQFQFGLLIYLGAKL